MTSSARGGTARPLAFLCARLIGAADPARLDLLNRLIEEPELRAFAKDLREILGREGFAQTPGVGGHQHLQVMIDVVIAPVVVIHGGG